MAPCDSSIKISTTEPINSSAAAMMATVLVIFKRAELLTMQNRRACQGCGIILVLLLAGCGKARTSPVEGEVLLDGKPLAGASIQFVAQGKGHDATGETDLAGRFVMSSFQPKDGALPGSYKV